MFVLLLPTIPCTSEDEDIMMNRRDPNLICENQWHVLFQNYFPADTFFVHSKIWKLDTWCSNYIFTISEETVKWLSVQNPLQQWKSVLGGWQSIAMGLLRQLANGLHLVSYHAYYLIKNKIKNVTLVVYFIVTMTSSTAFLSSLCSSEVLIACFYLFLYHLYGSRGGRN